MTEWNTNFDEAPREVVLLSYERAGVGTGVAYNHPGAIAWMPLPEPYQEPCPVQLTRAELSFSRKDLAGYTTEQIISLTEQRTLEIVEWHLRNRGMEGGAAHEIIEELKND